MNASPALTLVPGVHDMFRQRFQAVPRQREAVSAQSACASGDGWAPKVRHPPAAVLDQVLGRQFADLLVRALHVVRLEAGGQAVNQAVQRERTARAKDRPQQDCYGATVTAQAREILPTRAGRIA